MRRQFLYSLVVAILVCFVAYARQANSAPVGSWSGTWEGGSTGKFEMTITKGADGKLTGSLTANPTDGEGYTAKFKSVDVSGGKLTAKLADPQEEVEITLTASVDPTAMKGSYSVRTKAQGDEVDTGTWQAKKK